MYLVNTGMIKEKQAVVIDCRYDMKDPAFGPRAYGEGHLPGAFYIDLEEDMTAALSIHGGRHPLPDLQVFTETIGSFGITGASSVLIYDDGSLTMASRLWMMLRLIGLKDVFILKGGFETLQAEGFTLTQEVPKRTSSQLKLHLNDHLICDKDDVISAQEDRAAVIVDSRAPERYQGLEEPFDRIAGHIPGAVNYFWQDLFEGGVLKDYGKIEAHFLEMNNYDEIIVHCGSGITGCVNVLLMAEVGIDAKLYLGSYSDWISYPDHEVIIKNDEHIKAGAK